ncbi:RagB/SusD family nutrient uptake outer membrane protein [Yeosuana marina]|uniref:RagB/SusD family nutrient uptake outer membrane protein n=1 Tax=Yeosuana marina TaxID=1565536 RepID=UPI0030C8911C
MLNNIFYSIKKTIIKTIFFKGFVWSKRILLLLVAFWIIGCDDFVEVDAPKNLLVSETVFNDPSTVKSALANIYYKMKEQGLLSGNRGLSPFIGCYADQLDYLDDDPNVLELYRHTVTSSNAEIKNWWVQAYYLIYAANDIIDGLNGSNRITEMDKNQYMGEALFIRAYLHSLLANLFGDIPYITSTSYLKNNSVAKEGMSTINNYIIEDLKDAIQLMQPRKVGSERVVPDQTTAKALLARIYLFDKDWELASVLATEVINSPNYQLEDDISLVFLKNSSETIWQFKPDGINFRNTIEANFFIIGSVALQRYAINNSLIEAFEPGDLRKEQWIGSFTNPNNGDLFYYPYKYKESLSTAESLEYSIMFRLAEQYLIRAEAEAQLNKIADSQDDLNVIRNRANLPNTSADTKNELLNSIIQERRVELFSELGHRWFDLKRTDKASEILSLIKSNWKSTDILLPIPKSELELNPNLRPQNDGY